MIKLNALKAIISLSGQTKYFIDRALFYLTVPLIGTLLYFYGDTPQYFDTIYILLLALSCVFCWSDKDTLASLSILLVYWCFAHGIFWLPDGLLTMIVSYGICILISIRFFVQLFAKILFITTVFAIFAELYWWTMGFDNKPLMFYLLSLWGLTFLVREALLNKVFFMSKYFRHHSAEVALDYQVGKVMCLDMIVLYALIIEYFARHLAELKNLTYVYYQFNGYATISVAIMISLVYMNYFSNESKKHMKA